MLKKIKLLIINDKGQALIIVILAITILLGAAALTLDYGYFAFQKRNLQNAADAAALAAAWELPDGGDIPLGDEVPDDGISLDSISKRYSNLHVDNSFIDATKSVSKKEVQVDVGFTFDTIFGRVLGVNSTNINATATAQKYSGFAGEALPFVNMDDNFISNPEIITWEKLSGGSFERIWPDDYELYYADKNDDHSKTYFDVYYEDGISVTNGQVAYIKDAVGYIYEQNKPIFVFSLSVEAIASNKYADIGNKDVIAYEDLVLLKISFDNYDEKNKSLHVTTLEIYDLGNTGDTDYPDLPESVRLIK